MARMNRSKRERLKLAQNFEVVARMPSIKSSGSMARVPEARPGQFRAHLDNLLGMLKVEGRFVESNWLGLFLDGKLHSFEHNGIQYTLARANK